MSGGILIPGDWDDWRWGGRAQQVSGGPNPGFSEIDSTGVYGYFFSDGDVLQFHDLQLPHTYKEGTDLVPHIHFCASTTATYTGTWTLDFVGWLDIGSAVKSTKQTVTAAFDESMTAWQAKSIDFSAVITGVDRKISSCAFARLSLALSAGTSCLMLGLDAHFQVDRLGSTEITTK
jgi:hypothetical protein